MADNSNATGVGPLDLANRLSDLARTLEHEQDIAGTLQAIVDTAVTTIPGVQHASISAVKGKREVRTLASTSDLLLATDQAQYDAGEGPCLDALYDRKAVRMNDVQNEQRWPGFTKRVAEMGVGSMLCLQLYVEGDDLGAINLLNARPHAFDADSEDVAMLFAAHAAVALAGATQEEDLRKAISSRDLIGQAKGILMERFALNGDQAFRLLAQASQITNRKLTDIADELVQRRDLPAGVAPREDPQS